MCLNGSAGASTKFLPPFFLDFCFNVRPCFLCKLFIYLLLQLLLKGDDFLRMCFRSSLFLYVSFRNHFNCLLILCQVYRFDAVLDTRLNGNRLLVHDEYT